MKKILVFIMAFTMALCCAPVSALAAAQDAAGTESADENLLPPEESDEELAGEYTENTVYSEVYVNPLYADVVSANEIAAQTGVSACADTDVPAYDSIVDVAEYVRTQFKNRSSVITVELDTSEAPTKSMMKEIMELALEHTGEPTEGDYMRWQYGGWTGKMSYSKSLVYRINMTYNMSYYTTYAQEQAVTTAISSTINKLNLTGKTAYEKVSLIYDYICDNVEYDYETSSDYLRYTAYGALIENSAVCQGYSVLFYRMALEAGIDARIVTGTSLGEGHAWNIVKLGSVYYYLDSTWDAGDAEYNYFLRGSNNFAAHTVDSYSEELVESYNISTVDYADAEPLTVDAVSGLKIGGRAADALRLNWTKNNTASGYIIEQYKNKSWTRIARIANSSTVTYRVAGLSASTSYQFRICAFGFDGSTPLYSTYKTITAKTLPSSVSGLKIGGRAEDALRLNWTKNGTASGYIIEQYKDGSWTRIARIANNSTLTYRVEGLSAYTSYSFRICAFGFDGSTPLYSTYSIISGTTRPVSVSGLKIGGTATDALRLNWTKNSNADGYIIEQYKNGSWTRIARIANNSTVTYRVEGLSSKTTYRFRMRSFGFDGSTPVYSGYTYVNGTTN